MLDKNSYFQGYKWHGAINRSTMRQGGGLSNIQRELLKMFTHDLPESQLMEIKELLSKYFEGKTTQEMNALWEEKGWSEEQMETWTKEHMRKK